MYLLKRYGFIFLAVLILLVLALVLVILLYGRYGVFLPSFSFPKSEVTAPAESTLKIINDKINILSIGGTLK